jgi:hypothetical protein
LSSPETPVKRKGLITLIANVLLSGLAAGAVWCVLSLTTERDTTVLIIPLALIIAAFLRWQGYRGKQGATGSVAATLIAFVYAEYLFAAVNIAETLGFPLRDTLFKMDLPFAWQIVRVHVGWLDLALLAVALALAGYFASRPPRRIESKG